MRSDIHFICLRITLFFTIFILSGNILISQPMETPGPNDASLTISFEKDPNNTASYQETIDFYRALEKKYASARLLEMGASDAGLPIYVFVIDTDKKFDPKEARKNGKLIYLINNGIHPGEPCGVDASMLFARELLEEDAYRRMLEEAVILIVPMYNIGGALNRSPYTRANQVGPASQGFRGNAKNLDLNRDFVKADSKNAQSFNQMFARWKPDIFLDTHTSNGADYQYTMTMLSNQHDRVGGPLGQWVYGEFTPRLYDRMEDKGWEMIPYVNTYGNGSGKPEDGIGGFLDLSRYSAGYGVLHHSIGYTSEAHMLKPYKDRVESTLATIWSLLELGVEDKAMILEKRTAQDAYYRALKDQPVNWEADRERKEVIEFKGYESGYKPSAISGEDRLFYDRDRPFTKEISFYPHYKVSETISLPKAYVVPQAYTEVIERLAWNGVEMEVIEEAERPMQGVEVYYIEDYQTSNRAYEGHYLHSDVKVRKEVQDVNLRKGDVLIYTDQPAVRYIVETLEPMAPDSYFAWNFFDGILMQKEWYSAYVFEDLAADLLEKDAELKVLFEQKKANDPEFAKDGNAQLLFIYRNSPYYEKTHMRYPVLRLINN